MKPIRQIALFLLLALSSAGVFAAQSAVPMQEPAPIAIPAGVSAENVAKSIRSALAARTWVVSGEKPGYIEATLNVRVHMLKLGISYAGDRIVIKYLGSSEMNYQIEDGYPYIHPKFHNWTNNLVIDIKANLARI